MTNPELLIIITTVTTGIVSCINAVASGWGRKEIRQKAEEVKQVTQNVHEDIVKQVTETKDVIKEVVNGSNITALSKRIDKLSEQADKLSDQVSHIESWILAEQNVRIRTRSSEENS